MARKYSILAEIALPRAPSQWVISAKMLLFLATMVELTSETSHSALNDSTDGRAMLYRSQIDGYGAQISYFHHFRLLPGTDRRTRTHAHMVPVKNGAVR